MRTRILFIVSVLATALLPLRAADTLLITEFMAANTGPLEDEDGEKSDWIEIHNPSANTVNLNGWFLTDFGPNLVKWMFPATNIGPNGYMIVWASEKNRRVPGRPLHTNFKLDAAGEYLGLIRPDLSISSEYHPAAPPQVGQVSYGLPVVQNIVSLVTTGANARVYVPTNDSLGSTWLFPSFDDSNWLAAVTGVGYEADSTGPFVPALVADSVVDFTGKQGSNNWYYGYWNRHSDPNGVYSDIDMTFFPNANEAYGANNFFDGTNWVFFNGSAPVTQITAGGATPSASNGVPSRAEQWPIRRWVSEVSGLVKITGKMNHTGDWVYVTQTGVASSTTIYLYLTAAGDAYLDDMKLVAGSVPEVGANLLANGDFESALAGSWTVSDNHSPSLITTAVKKNGNSSLYIAATNGGTTQASSIWQTIPTVTSGNTYTLSYWYKPTTNNTPFVSRFSGGWINVSPTPCGDGVTGRVFVDGTPVSSQDALLNRPQFTVTVPVLVGSRVDFLLDPKTNDTCDASGFTVQIETASAGEIVVADSVADWSLSGTQGEKNWTYGYYNRTTDPGGVYAASDFIPFPRANTTWSANNFWTGSTWDWPNGNPPWDEIGQTAVHPNGVNNAAEHWVIRRWASEVSGRITVDWTVAKANASGNGVTGRVFHNGTQVDSVAIAGNNTAGASRSVVITNVAIGDFIDIALDPTGPGGQTDDGSDGSSTTAVIRGTPNLSSSVASDIRTSMQGVNASAFIRIPFVLSDPSSFSFMNLRMRYDDGFVAYLNGVSIASRNISVFPDPLTWSSAATTNRADADVNAAEDFDVTSFLGLLQSGTNVLAIQGLNASANDTDFLILPELRASSVTLGTNAGYFVIPTPGAANGATSTNIGPIISAVTHTPEVPLDNDPLVVTARVTPSFNAVSNVTLVYRVAFGSEVTVPMLDNGLSGDGPAGDGVFGATIPSNVSSNGQMVRYYISANDTRTNTSRMPTFTDPVGSPQYFGTIIHLPQTNSLPLFHWFIQNPAAAATEAGTRCSFFFNGQFFDNVGVTLHGQSSSGFPKKSHNFNLNRGYKIKVRPGEPDVSDFAITSTWADRIHVRNSVNTETYHVSGTPAHYAFPLRVQQNENFYMVANMLEQGNEEYLERIGYDPDGALYKMYNTFTGAAGNEKKTRKYESSQDLQDFYNAITQADVNARMNWIYDNVNLPSMVNFLAAKAIGSDHDCCHKNYYYYRDSNISGEWYALPWDFDLSYGHVWTSGNGGYFDDTIYTNHFVGIGNNNTLFAIMWADPTLKAMWTRRTRTLMDQVLQPPGVSTNADFLRNRLDFWAGQARADARLDKIRWGGQAWNAALSGPPNANNSDPTNNFEVELVRVRDYYLNGRRTFLNLASTTNSYGIPGSVLSNFVLLIGSIDYNPSSQNQAQEYIEIINTNFFTVDLSGWRLDGAVDFTFPAGTILGVTNRIYVSPDVKAFRSRTTGPRGGQRLMVVGPYKGQLSAHGETIALINPAGQTNRTLTYTGAPSLVQQYLRITELMYAPPAPGAGSPYAREEFEYMEFTNIGPVPLNLNGVHFTNGIEFAFTSATRTNMQAGERFILARNPAAFLSRYPAATNVIGPFIGSLDNTGENIRLDDAVGEKILDFTYSENWYPMTAGNGLSLVIVDENAPWHTWDLKSSWRPSSIYAGTPGTAEPPAISFAPILVNEVLSHSDFGLDYIELHNPTTNNVDISNWRISDDFINPSKYRVPNGTVIPAGGYLVISESQFNAGANPFSFSSKRDEAFVFSADTNGNPNGYFHGFNFEGAPNEVAFGRYLNSQGAEHFVLQTANTPNAANASPTVGPVVISEIMYHPPDITTPTNVMDNSLDEYIELRNLTGSAVTLHDPAYPTNRWFLSGGVEFTFSTNDVIASNSFIVVVNFNPTNTALLAAFRAKYGTPLDIPIVGPYAGKLDNEGEALDLYRPDVPDLSGTGYILVERVEYANTYPWDSVADGFGAALIRMAPSAYGNDPTNFIAAAASPGVAPSGASAPSIVSQPANANVFVGGTTNFAANVSGGGLVYQWYFNGNLVNGATNAVLTVTNAQNSQAGSYSYFAFNGAGSVRSSNALLTVITPVFFNVQPTNQNVIPGTNVTLAANAIGTGTVRYQWRFEGVDIPDATNATYSFTGANLTNHHGVFTCVAWDDISTVTSSNARIYVLVRPGIVQHVQHVFTLQGGTATFSLIATGAPPMGYRWVRDGVGYATTSIPVLTITNVQVNSRIRVIVTNFALAAGVLSPGPTAGQNVTNFVLADFDADGMADVWEAAYFGNASTNNNANALVDDDGDGMINRDEYIAGTNPTNALSLLNIVFSTTNAQRLEFVAQSNISYSVQWRTNLVSPEWTNLTSILGSPQVRTISVDAATAPAGVERYFRIVTPLVP